MVDSQPKNAVDLAALSIELRKIFLYPENEGWAGSTALIPAAFNGMKYVDAAHVLSSAGNPALRAVGLWATARCFYDRKDDVALYEGKSLGAVQLCLEALRHDPLSPEAYVILGYLAEKSIPVVMPDGRALCKQELYLEALRCDPCFANAYYNLGCCLDGDETVVLHDGRTLSERQLYLEALQWSFGDEWFAYNNLAETLTANETVVLHDGRELDKRQLYLEFLRRCSNHNLHAHTYCNLGSCLLAGETVVLHDGRALDRMDLFLEAVRCDSNSALAYDWLAFSLFPRDTITLYDGRVLSSRQLYLEVLRCDSNYESAYYKLGNCLSNVEGVTLHDGRTLSKHQLHLEALRCNPNFEYARDSFLDSLPTGQAWSRPSHSLVFGTMPVNVLFATLLLGLQRLETDGVLPPAHHSMLEDTIESWTWGDTQQYNMDDMDARADQSLSDE